MKAKQITPTVDFTSERAQSFWGAVSNSFDLEEHSIRLLELACEALDRAEIAKDTLRREGMYVADRYEQKKAHPACRVAKDAADTFIRLTNTLGLDVDEHGRVAYLRAHFVAFQSK